jgi:hypothetical protein
MPRGDLVHFWSFGVDLGSISVDFETESERSVAEWWQFDEKAS